MTKPIGYYVNTLESDRWLVPLQEQFGSHLEGIEFEEKLALRASITYWLFHQEIVGNSLGEYTLEQSAIDTMCGWIGLKESTALQVCQIVEGACKDDLEGLVEFLTAETRWGNL